MAQGIVGVENIVAIHSVIQCWFEGDIYATTFSGIKRIVLLENQNDKNR